MVLLLVVGLAAVIAVILIAVILSVRLGRHDDEELEDRPSERGRDRMDTGDPMWRDARTPRPRPQAQDRRYRDRDNRRPDRVQAGRPRDYDHPQQRPSRRDAAPGGSRRDNGGRRAGQGRERHDAMPPPYDATPAPYDTGTSPYDTGTSRLAADDFPSEPLHAADFPSAEFASRPQPAADYPSGEFPSAAQDPADAPTARYRAAVPRSDEFPSQPLPTADFASGEFAAADFASGEFPAADFPSEDMPAASPRGRSAQAKTGPGRGRSDSRRRSALGREVKGQDPPKGRSRQSRKRDDDDWPSTEWDKLTDEQYWAELSSDKPLATTARSARPAGEPTPAARNGRPRPAAATPTPPAAPVSGGRTRPRDVPGRTARPSSPREPAPVREMAQARDMAPAREMAPARKMAPAREPAAREREPVSAREPVTYEHDAVTERLPSRPRQQPGARHRSEMPPAARPDTTAAAPAGDPRLAMLASLATGPTTVPDDDPLTSPSFSRPAADSRSYRTTRKSARPGDTANGAHTGGPPAAHHGNGYGGNGHPAEDYGDAAYASNGRTRDRAQVNGAYQRSSHDDPGYGYIPAAPAATATPPAGTPQPASWSSPPAHARPQGNPYGSFVEHAPAASYPSIPPAGYQDQQPGADLPAYHGDHDRYQEPVYDALAKMYSAPVGAARPAGPATHPYDGGQLPQAAAYPAAGHPGDRGYRNGYAGGSAYADGYGNGGHPPGYPAADYAAGQYAPDDYDDDYPVGQG